MTSNSTSDTNTSPLEQSERVLDFIRGNLHNIEHTWGANSSQYASTRDIMEQLWEKHATTLREKDNNIKLDAKLGDLLAGMSLNEKGSVGPDAAGDVQMS